MISTGIKEVLTGDKTKSQKDYLTTTELARLCGVSRFTIINWVKKGKIKSFETIGGHRRIALSEVILFLEAFHIDSAKNGGISELLRHCWEFAESTSCDKKCGNCLIYKRQIDYCFLVVRQFGKEVICCEGDCLDCDYFNKFFNKRKQIEKPSDEKIDISKEIAEEKRNILYSFVYGVGRGVHGLKETVAGLRERFVGRPYRVNRQTEET